MAGSTQEPGFRRQASAQNAGSHILVGQAIGGYAIGQAACDLKMNRTLLSPVLTLLTVLAACQQTVAPAEFHWNSTKWQELSWKQSIGRQKLPPTLKADLMQTLVEQMREDQCGSDQRGRLSERQMRLAAQKARIAFVDLAARGSNEIIAQAGDDAQCSPTGNCSLWVLRLEKDGYHVILSAESEQTFTIQTTRTNGFRDLVLGMHGSAFESELRLYKFDGSSYKRAGCYEATWQITDEHGNAQRLEEPRISQCN
jgi:hypothetical protein